jgi:hypothetical protein
MTMVREDEAIRQVQHRLESLVAARWSRRLTRVEESEYRQLCELEWQLLYPERAAGLNRNLVDVDLRR